MKRIIFRTTNVSGVIRKSSFALIALFIIELSALATRTSSSLGQVDDLKAFFRSGQTFLTWHQIDGKNIHYRIYRSDKQRVAEVHDHTSLNFSASVTFLELNRLKGEEYQIKDTVYYVIDDSGEPLTRNTGLFVYTAKAKGKAYYAVTAVRNGVESRVLESGNVLKDPINEKVEFPGAVRQKDEYFVHWTDSEGTGYYPAMSSVPSVPYNFRIKTPSEQILNPALVITLHGSGMQYKNIGIETPKGEEAVLIALDAPRFSGKVKDMPEIEYPPSQGWMGYNENFGTEKPLSEGRVIPYTERRVLWMIDWAKHNYNIDIERVSMRGSSMGSMGVLKIGLTYPDRFASIHAIIPILDTPGRARNNADSKNKERSGSWLAFSPFEYLKQHPEIEFPYIQYTAGRLDNTVGWSGKVPFAKMMESVKDGFAFYWDLRAHVGQFKGTPPPGLIGPPIYWDHRGGAETMPLVDFSCKQSFPALANLSVNNDPGTVDFAVRGKTPRPAWSTPGAGDFIGTINGAVTWERNTIVDETHRYEITLKLLPIAKEETATADVTPRRLQQFNPVAGKTYSYEVVEEGSAKKLAMGKAIADKNGHITVIDMPITRQGTRLILNEEGF